LLPHWYLLEGKEATATEGTISMAHELEVRDEVPARRHELIFEHYVALPAGDHFLLVNDHAPKPPYYQFAAEHPGEFTWEQVDQGPERWSVRIGRTEPSA